MITKIDFAIAVLIGFFVGMFAIPTVVNLGIRDPRILLALPWLVAAVAFFGAWIGSVLARRMAFFAQLTRFVTVGVLNTAIDFGVLNGLSLMTGVTGGFIIGGVNLPGVAIAVLNAYLWNKYWVFSSGTANTEAGKSSRGVFHDFPKFLAVSGIGILLNSGIVIILTTFPPPALGVSETMWLNGAKVLATAVSLVWNFIGYKFFVFQSRDTAAQPGVIGK